MHLSISKSKKITEKQQGGSLGRSKIPELWPCLKRIKSGSNPVKDLPKKWVGFCIVKIMESAAE